MSPCCLQMEHTTWYQTVWVFLKTSTFLLYFYFIIIIYYILLGLKLWFHHLHVNCVSNTNLQFTFFQFIINYMYYTAGECSDSNHCQTADAVDWPYGLNLDKRRKKRRIWIQQVRKKSSTCLIFFISCNEIIIKKIVTHCS